MSSSHADRHRAAPDPVAEALHPVRADQIPPREAAEGDDLAHGVEEADGADGAAHDAAGEGAGAHAARGDAVGPPPVGAALRDGVPLQHVAGSTAVLGPLPDQRGLASLLLLFSLSPPAPPPAVDAGHQAKLPVRRGLRRWAADRRAPRGLRHGPARGRKGGVPNQSGLGPPNQYR